MFKSVVWRESESNFESTDPKTDALSQGWVIISHEGSDLEKMLKPGAARWWENKVKAFFWRSQSTYECDLQNKGFSPSFLFQFCTVKAYFLKITANHDI